MRKPLKTKIYNVILFILIIAFVIVGALFFGDYKKLYEQTKTYKDIKEQCVSNPTAQNDKKEINWKKLFKINSDIVAWIDIPGTPVDYPVVKSKDNDYYLTHDIHQESSSYGSIFIDSRLYDKPFQSKNLIIYGHNMGKWTDVMFGSLMEYKDNDYFKKHKYVYLYTPGNKMKYKVISIREVSSKSEAYKVDFEKGGFRKWLDNAVTQSIYSVDEKIENGHVLTLSTCTYGANRLVLHCIPEKN